MFWLGLLPWPPVLLWFHSPCCFGPLETSFARDLPNIAQLAIAESVYWFKPATRSEAINTLELAESCLFNIDYQ